MAQNREGLARGQGGDERTAPSEALRGGAGGGVVLRDPLCKPVSPSKKHFIVLKCSWDLCVCV